MTRPQTTHVYYFLFPRAGQDQAGDVSSFKATREAIAQVHHGRVLEGTREEVPLSSLDDRGRYRRLATGWGELAA